MLNSQGHGARKCYNKPGSWVFLIAEAAFLADLLSYEILALPFHELLLNLIWA